MSPTNTFSTGVPNNLNQPGTYHVFNYLRAGGSLVNIPLTIALIGVKSAAGTAVVGTVYDATNALVTDTLGGVSSPGALMARQAYACSTAFGRGPRVKITFVNESAGVANVKTITSVGTATADGNQIIRVSGRTFNVGVRLGDTAAINSVAIANALKAKSIQLPVIVTQATTITTLTHAVKGVDGIDVVVTVDQQVAGLTATVANTVVGTLTSDHQPGLDALSTQRYEGIALSNHGSADITEILGDIAVRWSAASKTWGYYCIGEMGTIATATALASAANHQSVIIGSLEGCLNTAGEIAATLAMLIFSREKPNAGYDGATVPLFTPNAAVLYTGPEVEAAIAAGLTPFTGIKDSSNNVSQTVAKCERLVTSKTTSTGLSGTVPDDRNRDIAVSRTGVALAIQLDIASNEALGADRNPDGVSQDSDSDKLIRDLATAILRAEGDAKILNPDFVESDVSAIQIEHDSITLGRNNVRIPYHPNIPLHQVAWVHDVIIGT